MDININFIIIVILYDEAFKYGDGMTFWVMLGQTLNHCDWNYVVCTLLVNLLSIGCGAYETIIMTVCQSLFLLITFKLINRLHNIW
jgi:hypothetical protein